MKTVNRYGTNYPILNVRVNIDGIWKLAREIYVNIDGVNKLADYSPIDKVTKFDISQNYASTATRFYYGSYWREAYPIVTSEVIADTFKLKASWHISQDGTDTGFLNQEFKLLVSPLETGDESTFYDTGLRCIASEYDITYFFEGDITQRDIKRIVALPVSYISGYLTQGYAVESAYRNI